MVMTDETAADPRTAGIRRSELASMIGDSVNAAFDRRSPAEPVSSPDEHARLSQDRDVPEAKMLRAIHEWSLRPDSSPPEQGEVVEVRQDGTVEIVSQEAITERTREAELRQAVLSPFITQLDGIGGLDIPWGSILLGTVPGAIVSEVVDGVMPPRNADGRMNFGNLAVKGGIAWAGVQFGPQFIGRKASGFFAAGLGLFIFADLLPVDQWVAQLVGLFQRGETASQNQMIAQHEQRLRSSDMHQGSGHSFIQPSQGDDALETLRALSRQTGMAA